MSLLSVVTPGTSRYSPRIPVQGYAAFNGNCAYLKGSNGAKSFDTVQIAKPNDAQGSLHADFTFLLDSNSSNNSKSAHRLASKALHHSFAIC